MNVNSITAQRGASQAIAFAAKGGVALSNLLGTIARNKAAEREGPVHTFLFLETHFSDGENHSIPVPGSKKEDAGNKPYDKYTSEVETDNGKKKVPGSWFTDVVRATDWAKEQASIVKWCDGKDVETMPEYISVMGQGQRADMKKKTRTALNDARTGLVKGAMLFLHVEEIAKINPDRIKIKMPFRQQYVIANGEKVPNSDGNGFMTETVVSGSNIRLIDPAGEFEDKVMSVSEFLSLKISKMVGKPEEQTIVTVEKWKERGAKGGSEPGGASKNKIKPPTDVEGLLNLFNIAGTALDDATDQGKKLLSKLLAKCATAGEEGDDAVETVGDFLMKMDDEIWTVINARYNAIKARKNAAANQAAAKSAA